MKYKVGDKVVVEIKDAGTNMLGGSIYYVDDPTKAGVYPIHENQILGKLSDFWQQKIRFTKAEKAEFDDIRTRTRELFRAFEAIGSPDTYYPHLKHWIKKDDYPLYRNDREILFAKAWYCPEWIQVEKEKKYRLKIFGECYLAHDTDGKVHMVYKPGADEFTQSEIDKLQKLPEFSAIDLNKCKEAVEDE